MIAFGCELQAQDTLQAEQRVKVPGLRHSILAKDYNVKTAHIKLIRSNKIFISGAVLAPASIPVEIVGLCLVFAEVLGQRTLAWSVTAETLVILAPFLLPTGVVMLVVGSQMERKWKKVQNNLQLTSGILSNGHVGLALNF